MHEDMYLRGNICVKCRGSKSSVSVLEQRKETAHNTFMELYVAGEEW